MLLPSHGIGDRCGMRVNGTTTQRLSPDATTTKVVFCALQRLPERYQTVLLLKDGEGMKERDAVAMWLSISAVKALLHRARSPCARDCSVTVLCLPDFLLQPATARAVAPGWAVAGVFESNPSTVPLLQCPVGNRKAPKQ